MTQLPDDISDHIRKRQRFKHVWLPGWMVDPFRRCPHIQQRGIYGDEIIQAGYKRARCLVCGRLLNELPPEEKR